MNTKCRNSEHEHSNCNAAGPYCWPRLAVVPAPAPARCAEHPAYEPDYCPLCGTARVIGEQP